MKTLNVLIVDDEALARDAIKLRLEGRNAFRVCAEAANGPDAVALATTLQPDIIFLDIEMPEVNGIDTARQLCALGPQNIVFVTAYDEFAIEAFQVNAVDYLLKPIKDEQFVTTLLRLADRINARQTMVQNKRIVDALETFAPDDLAAIEGDRSGNHRKAPEPRRIAIKDGLTTKLLDVDTIESVVSGKDYVCIKVNGDVLVHRCTMKKFVDGLPSGFVRCHRSHTVNMARVTEIGHNDTQMELVCESGDRHPVSRRYRTRVKKRLLAENL